MRSDLRSAAGGLLAVLTLLLAGCYEGDPTGFHDSVVVGRDRISAIAVSGEQPIIEVGTAVQLTATGTTPTGTVNITRDVTWSSSDPAAVTVDDNGRVRGIANGTATITATLAQFTDSVSITASDAALTAIVVSGATDVDECGSATYTASGQYDDATVRDITTLASWGVTDTAVARMSTLSADRNTLFAKSTGTVGVVASRSGIDSPALTVTVADNLLAIDVTPNAPAQLDEGDTLTFTATGTWASGSGNISRATTWSVANDAAGDTVAAIAGGDTNPGRLTAQNGGTATVTGACGGLQDTVPVTVVYLDTLEITNTRPIELTPGQTVLLALEGTYSDSSTRTLNESATWSVETVTDTPVTVSNTAGSRGRVTAGSSAGVSEVVAKVDGKEARVTITVAE